MNWTNRICTLNLWDYGVRLRAPRSPTQQRLAEAFARIQDVEMVRNHHNDAQFGKSIEERIVWRELLDLEIQALDEQIERTSAAVIGIAD